MPRHSEPEGERIEAALVLDTRALGRDRRRAEIKIVAAMRWL